jgi:hypothetical protein
MRSILGEAGQSSVDGGCFGCFTGWSQTVTFNHLAVVKIFVAVPAKPWYY